MIKSKQGYNLYSREEMLQLIKDWYNKTGKIVIRDLRHKNGLPSSTQVINEFGSFQQCLIEAGISIEDKNNLFNREHLSDEQLLEDYKKFVKEHLKNHMYLPTYEEIDNCNYIQSAGTYEKRFGTFREINKMIGYDPDSFNKDALEKDMILKYKQACKDFGHTLTSREITKLSKETTGYIYSMETYTYHFGTLHYLQEVCGLDKTRCGKNATRDEMIERLQWLGNELGRRPVQTDLKYYKNVPSANAYRNEFGSFKIALNEAGFEKRKIFRTKNGVKLRSWYELKLAQVLESYGIEYENEIMYKDVIPNFDRKYRFDFRIKMNSKSYYIELFGIQGNELYEKRKQEKIQLCEKNNIPLIQIYQTDIYSKLNKEIYEMLLNRIQDVGKEAA